MKEVLKRCDCKMMRFIAEKTWEDCLTNAEVAERRRVSEQENELRAPRPRWFGHMERDCGEIVKEVVDMAGRLMTSRKAPQNTRKPCSFSTNHI